MIPVPPDADAVPKTNDIVARAQKFLAGVTSIDFTKAEARHAVDGNDQQPRGFYVGTFQDEAHPSHVLQWSELEGGLIRINSYQYAKCVPPRSSRPRAVRFILPVKRDRGVRRDLRAALDALAKDASARRKLNVMGVEVVRETPADMEWMIVLF